MGPNSSCYSCISSVVALTVWYVLNLASLEHDGRLQLELNWSPGSGYKAGSDLERQRSTGSNSRRYTALTGLTKYSGPVTET